ncbi:hypothetical protein SEUCBS139899_001023 [Sporothrix eucalyptigena]|uniref:Uncharacterized protein n=1 Tax=Sporothrix eucalyptigena TaxID=1812306 RepID=A0ABP0CNJ0_9PEZI
MSTLSLFTGPMTLLTASNSTLEVSTLRTQEPSTTQSTVTKATTVQQTELPTQPTASTPSTHHHLSLHSPTASLIYRCHHSATQAWTLAATAAQPVAWVIHHTVRLLFILSTYTLVLAQVVLQHCWQALCWACWWHLWACPPATRLRKKLYLELALAVMGPSGNGVLLVVLWPGWLVVGAGVWGLSLAAA